MKKTSIPEMYSMKTNGINILTNHFSYYKSHRHDFYEFEYLAEGEGRCEINGKSFSLKKGDLMFETPTDCHSYQGDKEIKTVTVHFYLEKRLMMHILNVLKPVLLIM